MGPLTCVVLVALLTASPLAACQPRDSTAAHDAVSEALPAASLQVAPANLMRLEITQPGGEPVTLSAVDGQWSIVAPFSYPAKVSSVEVMLAVLAELEIVRRVAAGPEPAHRLAPDARVVVKTTTRDGAEQTFAIGASKREETFVQRFGEEQVFAVRGACRRFFDLSLQQLRAPIITNLDITEIQRVRFVNPSGRLEFVPSPGDATRFVEASPSIPNFNSERASKDVAVLATLFAKGFVDRPVDKAATGLFGEDTPHIEVSLHGSAQPLNVYIGARTKNGLLHLRTSTSEQVYLVSGHLSSSLMPRPEHFARTSAEMRALIDSGETKGADEQNATIEPRAHAEEHTHGNTRPTEVPPELMKELRALAAEQRS